VAVLSVLPRDFETHERIALLRDMSRTDPLAWPLDAAALADPSAPREGLIDEQTWYRALARWLDLPFIEAPFPPGPGARYPESLLAGLAPGPDGLWIVAPEGERIAMLAAMRARLGPSPRLAIAAPSTLRLSIRRAFAQTEAREASLALPNLDPEASARTPGRATLAAGVIGFSLAALVAIAGPGALGGLVAGVLALLFAACVGLRLLATAESGAPPAHPPLADSELPEYTIVAALYREAKVASKLVAALDALDYPRSRLQILLVVEEEDFETRAALCALNLPARYEIVSAPDGRPRTKPRALNVALAMARGELITIYDAEDEPEPDQLRKAAAAFAALPAKVSCLQARLAIDNIDDGLIPRLFAIEYATLFCVLNPGLSALDAPVALGGTSNHFRTHALRDVGGWDAWNVTEDIDLGFRLARHGYSVGALDSTTHEEAPARLPAWMGQRRRWFKGWMQTLATHGRNPRRLLAEAGPARAAAMLILVTGALAGPMFGPLFALAYAGDLRSGELLAPAGVGALAGSTLWICVWIAGLAAVFWPAALGVARQRLWPLLVWLPLLPFYWLLMSAAAWMALFDLFRNPHHWVKTEHGLARTSRLKGATQPVAIDAGAPQT
jgi:cellulose synthase/poly-beta-1,6-N-acetylglucosamine synthase-like glycosyltransferase